MFLLQPWSNEAERQKVLDEKHGRGAEARAIRRAVKDRHKSKGLPQFSLSYHPKLVLTVACCDSITVNIPSV